MSSHDLKPNEPAALNAGIGQDEKLQSDSSSTRIRAPTPLDAWLAASMRNMRRMAVDEEYRRSIAQHLS